jgi:class 3 adenylate cyclase
MTTLQTVELGVLGPLQVRQYGLPVAIPGVKPRAILTMLGLHGGSVVSADTFLELLWGEDPPRTAAKALQTHISSLRRTLGDGFVLTEGTGWTLRTTEVDATRYKLSARMGRDAVAAGDTSQAVARFDEALTLWRGTPELPDGPRGVSEKTRWIEGHAALVEDRADALLATGRAAEIIGDLEAAIADAPLRERRWGQLMLALYRAGRQGEALGAYQRARSLLADELGVDPGPDLRRLEAAIVAQDAALEMPVPQQLSSVTRAVTFLLTDIEGSTAAWEADADAMAVALARHDELVEQVVTSRGGRLVKTRGEGDATFSVFDRPSTAAAAAIDLQEAIRHEPWALSEPMRIRVALHTGEVELRDGDYFGRAVNRAARLRSLAAGGQILCSGATAELVIDSLSDDVVLADLGMRELRNLARPEHVFELRLETADDSRAPTTHVPMERPNLPAVLAGPGPFVGRGPELERLLSAWQTALAGGAHAVLIAGEPGVGKTRLAGEWSRHAYEQGAVVLYGRCDEDLGAPYQPFAEVLRSLIPCLGASRLRGLRGIEALLSLVPGLTDVLPDLAAPTRADPDTERYALFDAVVAVLGVASTSAPVVLILDDLHWAAKPTLLLLRHLLRFGEHARVQIVGTYRSTDLDRSHPLAAMLADLHRDGSATRLQLSGLDEVDVSAYVAEAGYDDEELARALASVTGGNPFFLIEALRHVDESGGRWDPSTLPQGVREAVSRRLSRLPAETNKALAAAAVVGSRFALELVERVVGDDLVDAFDEACKAGIVIEEPGGRYRFNHAIVRQSLLAELASVRRMRLHQSIAATLETEPGADDELLADLAHHYFECAWAGNAAKAVDYCRRAADQAMARLAYEGAADLYDRAVHALEEVDEELPDRDDQQAELLVARCEALLAAGDVVSAAGAVSQLQAATRDSARLAAWGTCFDGQLSMLTDPERLDEIESALAAAAEKLAGLDDAAGEAKAHTVRAGCLARLGRIADAETALDHALTAARRAREHRRVNAVLANAPLAALWGPNPVPRAGGRCLDVVRLLRITTGSPVVEATSTRCQAVLDALRGRAAAGRSLLDSARRTLTELGMRHALLEVDQFAGILELVADDPAAAEPHLRRAYNGFRRMGLDADTAETAALLARACLALDRDAEADELCTESERLAGHALKASIAWRTVRAQLLARGGAHDEARRVAEEAVAVAERTDLLVDHGDACLALATVLGIAGDNAGARAAAERAVGLYELKGAAALAEKARSILGERNIAVAPAPTEPLQVELDNACVRAIRHLEAAVDREAWDEVERLVATDMSVEGRRKVIGFPRVEMSPSEWAREIRHLRETGAIRHQNVVLAVRGERLALTRSELGTEDESPGAPQVELLRLFGLDEGGRIAILVAFDLEDIDAATAELDAAHARLEDRYPRAPFENAASRADAQFNMLFADRRFDEIGALFAEDIRVEDRRRGLRREGHDRATELAEVRAIADVGTAKMTSEVLAMRGVCLALVRTVYSGRDDRPEAFHTVVLRIAEIGADGRIVRYIAFDADDFDAALEELDARYLAGEAAVHARTWSIIAGAFAVLDRHELPSTTPDFVDIDHRRGSAAPGEVSAFVRASWDLMPDMHYRIAAVYRLNSFGGVVTHVSKGTSQEGFDAEWRVTSVVTVEGDLLTRCEIFDEADLDTAIARFEQLSRPTPRLENAASRVYERLQTHFSAREWDAMAETMAADIHRDDRRRVVYAEANRGREATITEARAVADLGAKLAALTVVAVRGERLALVRSRFSGRDKRPEGFHIESLGVVEINRDEQVAEHIMFDLDDLDAAIAELDARYLGGEAAPCARIWQFVMNGLGVLNRHEPGPMTREVAYADHRRLPFAAGDFGRAVEDLWALVPDARYRVTAVHALDAHGVVGSLVIEGTDLHGNELQWARVCLISFASGQARMDVYEEDDLDAALAGFEELHSQARRLENAATLVYERLHAQFTARDWDGITAILADDYYQHDRRPVVGGEIRSGRGSLMEDLRAAAVLGITEATSDAIATRGERLTLIRVRYSRSDEGPKAYRADLLQIVEIDADERIATRVVFDLEDIDAAFEELDAQYLAGEAAPHRDTWSLIARNNAAFNRHEFPSTMPDWVTIDHRRVTSFEPGDMTAYIRATWDVAPDATVSIETVHRLSDLGAVITRASTGTSQRGFDAEWRVIALLTVEGDLINRCELFDETDLDAALARFDELSRSAPRLENAASKMNERFLTCFAARDWEAMAALVVDDSSIDDRRRVVNAGLRRGRDAEIASMRAIADLGVQEATSVVIATRGERLALSRDRFLEPKGFLTEVLGVLEINADERIGAVVVFDVDDLDAAFEELDARYLACQGATHAHTWSVVAGAFAAINRHELPELTPDWVNIDHRRGAAFAPGDMTAYIHALWDDGSDINVYIEAVHRLSNLGAVVTQAAHGTSQQGFEAEWREIGIFTFDGDLLSRCELFDEADLDAALAKFDELSHPAPQLENATSRVTERFLARFAARNWDAMAELLTDDTSTDDRRPLVGVGFRCGRDDVIADWRATAEVGVKNVTLAVVATRGERLALTRLRFMGRDERPEAFRTDVLGVVEINTEQRIAACVMFDLNNIDAAFEELDTRYLAGEAAAHAHTWSVIANAYVTLNRRELPPTTPDWVNVDHRGGATAFAPGDQIAYMRADFEQSPDINMRIEAVHRLSDLGAVVTNTVHGISQEGFEAEWREIGLTTVAGDQFDRSELFDEADLDTALAKFDELSRPSTPRLRNAASQLAERFSACFAARDWDAMAEMLATDYSADDRRRVVNAGIRHGRDTEIENFRAAADLGFTDFKSAVVATRGEHVVLTRLGSSVGHQQQDPFRMEMFGVTEISADERIAASVAFDLDDIDAAFEELDARYLAGEAAAHSHTWSVITGAIAALNRRELPATTPDWLNIDRRRIATIEPGDMMAYLRAMRDLMPQAGIYIEAVHRLNDFGTVITHVTNGTSREGFDAEWRQIDLLTVGGDLINRCELFDEEDIDAALTRFDELSRPAGQLENAASRAFERFQTYFAARDWTAMAEILAEDMCNDDRRRVVGAGVLHGRDTDVAHMRAIADVGAKTITSTVIATRGERLVLRRVLFSGEDQGPETFEAELLGIVEIDADERIVARLSFDADDVAAAFEELDIRYLAGESAAHTHTWSVIAATYAAFNRHGLVPDWVSVDHRRGSPFASSDLNLTIRTSRDLTPDLTIHIETVHRLSAFGAVVTNMSFGTSDGGFAAEWRMVQLLTIDGDRITRLEIFDEDDIDAALARFDELNRPAPQLQNAATRTWAQCVDACNRRDADGFLALTSADGELEDRRKGLHVSLEGSARRKAAQSLCRAPKSWRMEVEPIAVRGDRLGLTRERWRDTDEADRPITVEALTLTEVAVDELVHYTEVFDPDDIDEAFAALDARYLAGEGAAHSHAWSIVMGGYATFNHHELPAFAPDWENIDHRRAIAFAPGDHSAYIHATWDLGPHFTAYAEVVHRLSSLGAVVTHAVHGTTHEGFEAEWRETALVTVEGDLVNRVELFDQSDIDAALARFDELSRPAPLLENAATRARALMTDAFNRRDLDGFVALMTPHEGYVDRRKGLRDEGPMRGNWVRALFEAPKRWRLETEPVATRGSRLGLTRDRYRDTSDSDRTITAEHLTLTEVGDDNLVHCTVLFDPDDINGVMGELTDRWIASGEVAHPEVIEAHLRILQELNRHDWDAWIASLADVTYVNHRQLGTGETIADFATSVTAIASLIPNVWVEQAEILKHSASGAVGDVLAKGTSSEGVEVEIPMVLLGLFDGDRLTHFELFDADQRDLALSRFDELN